MGPTQTLCRGLTRYNKFIKILFIIFNENYYTVLELFTEKRNEIIFILKFKQKQKILLNTNTYQ